jgi:hypothetical protein
LESLATSYQKSFPQVNKNLNSLGARLLLVESGNREATGRKEGNRFLHFDTPSITGAETNGDSKVLESEFEEAKRDIESAFLAVRASIQNLEDGRASRGDTGYSNVASASLKRLGEIKGRATGEFSAHKARWLVG